MPETFRQANNQVINDMQIELFWPLHKKWYFSYIILDSEQSYFHQNLGEKRPVTLSAAAEFK